jgi:hypothetical protein
LCSMKSWIFWLALPAFFLLGLLDAWRWDRYIIPKCHVISQKSADLMDHPLCLNRLITIRTVLWSVVILLLNLLVKYWAPDQSEATFTHMYSNCLLSFC